MWGSSFLGWHPARIRRSFLPSSSPPPQSRTHSLTQHKISPLTHKISPLTHIHTHNTRSHHGCGARGRRWGPGSLRSVRRSVRDCRRGCGARGRRWGPGSLRSVRRSVQRLQKCLRRAWSPLGARLSSETAEGPPARLVTPLHSTPLHSTPSLHSLTHSLARSLARSLTHSLTHSRTPLTPLTLTHSLHSLTHSLHSLLSLTPLYILLALPAVVGIDHLIALMTVSSVLRFEGLMRI